MGNIWTAITEAISNEENQQNLKGLNFADISLPNVDFNARDGNECIENLRETYEWSVDMRESYQKNKASQQERLERILENQKEYEVELVENPKFLEWASKYRSNKFSGGWELPEETKNLTIEERIRMYDENAYNNVWPLFIGGEDIEVQPLRDTEQLEKALRALYWYRASMNLEAPAIMDMMQFPDLSGCSVTTSRIGWRYQSFITDAVGLSMSVMN